MTQADLATLYHRYIDCLNNQDWDNLGHYVHPDASHNGRKLGVAGYRAMLERVFSLALTSMVKR